MSKYSAKVAWNGNHYEQGQEVSGGKIEVKGDGKLYLYDDEENYVAGLGDLTRYAWVEIDPLTVEGTDEE